MHFEVGLVISLLSLAIATPLRSIYAVKETHKVPVEFTREAEAPKHEWIHLQVSLKQGRFEELERHLYEVSDPDHPRYGQHLSQLEVDELVRPTDETLNVVREWLQNYINSDRIESNSANDTLSFALPIAEAERLLDTKYSVYRHIDGYSLVRTHTWSLPLYLHDHITTIQPTTAFMRLPIPQRRQVMAKPAPIADAELEQVVNSPKVENVCRTMNVTPLCLRTLYETIDYKPKVPGKNQIALCNYAGEFNAIEDLRLYLEKYRPDAVSAIYNIKQVSINNGTLQQSLPTTKQFHHAEGLEGALDIQDLSGLTWPTPLTTYSTAGHAPCMPDARYPCPSLYTEPYLAWLNYVLDQSFIPQVISQSYGENEDQVPRSYAKLVCSKLAQLGTRGVSLFFASGDGGVEGVQSPGICTIDERRAFIPIFPASCPYVTAVGGKFRKTSWVVTYANTAVVTYHFDPEIVARDVTNGFVSGAGFSNYFRRPEYQADEVEGYLKVLGNDFAGLYNRSGRAYPDVSAQGVNYTIFYDKILLVADGASASTPTVASIFSLLNDALISHGRPPMGFLNPWLYKNKDVFVDVTSGSTLGCNTTGFPAAKGWDAASGVGTPRFLKLLNAVGLDPSEMTGV